jgi:hypothetical protein
LSEAGISPKVRARAKRWLSDYAPRVRPDLI